MKKKNLHWLTLACLLGIGGNGASAAVSGYYHLNAPPGHSFLAVQLVGTNDLLSDLIPTPNLGTRVYLWNVTNQTFLPPAIYIYDEYDSSMRWDPIDFRLPVGTGFVLYNPGPGPQTFTIVGEIPVGTFTTPIAGSNRFSLVASTIPQGGPISGQLAFPMCDGDVVHSYCAQPSSCFAGYGWFDPGGVAGTNGPVVNVGQAFFVQHLGPDTDWVQTLNLMQAPGATLGTGETSSAEIRSLKKSGGLITLEIENPRDSAYNVEFSVDGVRWTTVATRQKGTVWQGPDPEGPQGFYQLTNP